MRISDWSSDVCSSDLPNIIAAGLIFFIGLVIAKIVRRITEGALLAANADAWLRKTGLIDGNGTLAAEAPAEAPARSESGVQGKSVSVRVDLGGRRIIKKNNKQNNNKQLSGIPI